MATVLEGGQISLTDTSKEYTAFVEKFKPKKTTDDCYTPDSVYEIVRDWACKEYGIDPAKIVRPFWPGGDYERYPYPEGCVVLDNPPFSILSEIVKTYNANGIRYFLWCPYLTCIGIRGCCKVVVPVSIEYENGAKIDTAFCTNLEDKEARTSPELYKLLDENEKRRARDKRTELPKYEYPVEVLTAARLGWLCKYGIEFSVEHKSCFFIRALNSQRDAGKAIYGSGLLLSERAAAEKAAAEKAAAEKAATEKAAARRWPLSDHERAIIASLE